MSAAFARAFSSVPDTPVGVEVRDMGDMGGGRGLVARRAFRRGEVLFTEDPIVSAQRPANAAAVRACQRCLRSLVPASVFGDALPRPDLWPAPPEATQVQCEECGAGFCDRFCRAADRVHGHGCSSPLVRELFISGELSATRMYPAMVVALLAHVQHGGAAAVAELEDIAGDAEEADDLIGLFDPAALRRAALEAVEVSEAARAWFTDEVVRALLAKLCRNVARLAPMAPFQPYFGAVRRLRGDQRDEAVAAVLALAEGELREADTFFNERCGSDGAGLFSLQSKANHGCEPNAEVRSWHFASHSIDLVAVKDIAEGEEVTISYVAPDTEPEERRALLQDTYGFACRCGVCASSSSDSAAPPGSPEPPGSPGSPDVEGGE